MKEEDIDGYCDWYIEKRPLYELLAKKVYDLVKEVLDAEKIDYANIEFRAKEIDSFANNLEKGIIFNPKEMQDLAGIRIIGYVNSDVDKITKVIKELFEIDEKRSVDKSQVLGTDKVGYRSIHFIAKLPEERTILMECKKFEGLYFEIQIRTILQHAWAEIEHDRNYKFAGVLPPRVQRRFALLAGHLELADNEFDNISKSIEKYSKEVSEKTKVGDLNIVIDSTSLRQYLNEKFKDVTTVEPNFGTPDKSKELIGELNDMGVNTLKELDKLFPLNLRENLIKFKCDNNFLGLVRDVLMINNADEYFKKAWKGHWQTFGEESETILKAYGISPEELTREYLSE